MPGNNIWIELRRGRPLDAGKKREPNEKIPKKSRVESLLGRSVTRWIKYANLVGSRNWGVREVYAANGRQQGNYLSWRHAIRRSSATWLLSHCSEQGWAGIRFPSQDQVWKSVLATLEDEGCRGVEAQDGARPRVLVIVGAFEQFSSLISKTMQLIKS